MLCISRHIHIFTIYLLVNGEDDMAPDLYRVAV